MSELDVFSPVFTDGLWPPETIIIPVIGIIAALLIGKFGGRFIKLLARIRSRIGSGFVQSDSFEYWYQNCPPNRSTLPWCPSQSQWRSGRQTRFAGERECLINAHEIFNVDQNLKNIEIRVQNDWSQSAQSITPPGFCWIKIIEFVIKIRRCNIIWHEYSTINYSW